MCLIFKIITGHTHSNHSIETQTLSAKEAISYVNLWQD